MFEIYELIAKHEGLRLKPYRCTAGHFTIGYGHNLDAKGIDLKIAHMMLHDDIEECKRNAFSTFPKAWNNLNPPRKAVIISMIFTLGHYGFEKFILFIKAINESDFVGASFEMKNSRWYLQARNRVNDLSNIMRSGEFLE